MSFEFNEEAPTIYTSPKKETGLRALLVKKGLAKDTQQANIILIGILALCLLSTLILLWPEPKGRDLTPLEIENAGSPSEITNS